MKILTCIFLGVFAMSLTVVSVKGGNTIWPLMIGILAGVAMLMLWDVYAAPNLIVKDHKANDTRRR